MQLFLVVALIVLASALMVVVVRHRRERIRPTIAAVPPESAAGATAPAGSPAPGSRQICPACGRQYPAELRFCPVDARSLVPVGGDSVAGAASGTQCPRCGRLYDASKRYCPFDSEELVAPNAPVAVFRARRPPVAPDRPGAVKICPFCSARYDLDATQCGRDGAALVSVN